MSAVLKDEYKPYRAGDVEWIYPYEQEAPKGVKLNILQEGGVAIQGEWRYGVGFVAWQYMFKRNKIKEAANSEWLKQRG